MDGSNGRLEDEMNAHQIDFEGIRTDQRADAVDLDDPAQNWQLPLEQLQQEQGARNEEEVPTEPATSPPTTSSTSSSRSRLFRDVQTRLGGPVGKSQRFGDSIAIESSIKRQCQATHVVRLVISRRISFSFRLFFCLTDTAAH